VRGGGAGTEGRDVPGAWQGDGGGDGREHGHARCARVGTNVVKLAGVDVGSPTVKAVLVEDGKTLWQDYQRHNTRQGEKVLEFLGRMETKAGFAVGDRVFFTGSGAGALAPLVGGKVAQEVVPEVGGASGAPPAVQ